MHCYFHSPLTPSISLFFHYFMETSLFSVKNSSCDVIHHRLLCCLIFQRHSAAPSTHLVLGYSPILVPCDSSILGFHLLARWFLVSFASSIFLARWRCWGPSLGLVLSCCSQNSFPNKNLSTPKEVLTHSVMSGSATPWTVARQAPLSMGFSRQEWLAISSPRGSSQPWDQTHISYICQHWEAGSLPAAPPISSHRLLLFIQQVGACYITQGAQLGALWWPKVVG